MLLLRDFHQPHHPHHPSSPSGECLVSSGPGSTHCDASMFLTRSHQSKTPVMAKYMYSMWPLNAWNRVMRLNNWKFLFVALQLIWISFLKKYIYLFGYASSWLQHSWSLILVVTCEIFSCGMWDLVSWLGTERGPPALWTQSLSHWTTKEVPEFKFK